MLIPISGPVLAWYDRYRRDFPFRNTRDPYRIYVSEIMLQQTRTETDLLVMSLVPQLLSSV